MGSLFLTFLKLGAFIFGSGHALANAMQSEIVDKRGWLTVEQFQSGWASGNVLPGPIAPKIVAYTGYQQAGILGAYVAVVAYLIPSVTGMTVIAAALSYSGDSTGAVGRILSGMRAAVRGIKPAVLALLLDAFLSFTGVSMPKGPALTAQWLPFAVVMTGALMSLLGMWWMASGSNYLLADVRAIAIFALALAAFTVLQIDTIYVMLGAASVGLTYLAF